MSSAIVGHVFRRGLEASSNDGFQPHKHHGFPIPHDLPGVFLIVVATIFWVGMLSLHYTFGEVISTIAMVESPTMTEITVEQVGEKGELVETETITKLPPVTSKFFGSLKALRARAGRFAGFRGLSMYLAYNAAAGIISTLFLQLGLGQFSLFLSTVATTIILCGWGMAWTHIVISMPTNEWFGKRIPSIKTWKKIVPATAVYAIANHITSVYPTMYFRALNLDIFLLDPNQFFSTTTASRQVIVFQFLACILMAFALTVLVLFPTAVMMTRIQASLLPEQNEAIFPFDRTFGGRVVSEADGGNGTLGLRDAWQSFDWASRIRLLKLYGKLAAVEGAVVLAFCGTLFMGQMIL